MSTPAATSALLDLLEARFAMRILWALRDGHPQTFRLLQDSVGGITPNTLNSRIKELRAAGLMDHGGEGYVLTGLGQDLVRRLQDLASFAGKWMSSQDKASASPGATSGLPRTKPPTRKSAARPAVKKAALPRSRSKT